MRGKRKIGILALVLVALAGSVCLAAEGVVQEGVEKRLQDAGMTILTGDVWQTMSMDSKVAFVWGIGHAVTIEQDLAARYPELKAEDFSAKFSEGMAGTSINDVVKTVDAYYEARPADLNVPVVKVIWDEMIKPDLKTGVAGKPIR